MLDRLFTTISNAYEHRNGVKNTPEDINFACKIANLGKMTAVAMTVIGIVLGLIALLQASFLLGLAMSMMTLVARDSWKICDNIEKMVTKSSTTEVAVDQFSDNTKYGVAHEATLDSWLIAPITLAFIGR